MLISVVDGLEWRCALPFALRSFTRREVNLPPIFISPLLLPYLPNPPTSPKVCCQRFNTQNPRIEDALENQSAKGNLYTHDIHKHSTNTNKHMDKENCYLNHRHDRPNVDGLPNAQDTCHAMGQTQIEEACNEDFLALGTPANDAQ